MLFTTKTLAACACSLLLAGQALAGASLDTLLNGGSLFSANGKLEFSDFQFDPILNAPSASDIEIESLDSGLLFDSPALDAPEGIEYSISYKVMGIGANIISVAMQSASAGGDQAGIYKIVEDERGNGLTTLANVLTDSGIETFSANLFDSQESVYVRDNVFSISETATGLNDVEQTFGTADVTPTAAPTPTAALAGMALLSVIGLRRRRGGESATD